MIIHAWATVRCITLLPTDRKVEQEDAVACILDWAHEKLGWNGAAEEQIREVLRRFHEMLAEKKREDETGV